MTYADALILGIVQGLTEFLPVSSSGHLVLGREVFGLEGAGGVSFDVVVHLGTLASVFVVLWDSVRPLFGGMIPLFTPHRWRLAYGTSAQFRTVVRVGLGTVPVVIVVLLLHERIEGLFADPRAVAGILLVTALILVLPLALGKRAGGDAMTLKRALCMGAAQALAVCPGISRSGTTITAGLLCGVDRAEAGIFSFLLAIPAILGATVFMLPDMAGMDVGLGVLLTGFLASFASGALALRWLLRLVRGGKLWLFSPYLAVVSVAFLLFG